MYPDFRIFQRVCGSGLSAVRPLRETARQDDPDGWNYGSGWPPSYSAYGRMRALMAVSAAISLSPKSLLEVAAGDAALCASLASKGCQVAANDLRRENLERAVGHFENGRDIRLLPGNLFDLDPKSTGLFDLVVACEIIEHVAHTVDFLRQLRRFVAPEGRILLTTPNGAHFRNELPTHSQIKDFTELESRQFKPDADGHLFLITPAEMIDLAKAAGLVVEQMTLWGSPIITGHTGFRWLSGRLSCRTSYYLERLMQRLPLTFKNKLCFSLSVVLRPATGQATSGALARS
jgi:2-polyprenyl-3-methyl-5-hydroxy-6-metoxy-1,4-benzoquinol methylase